MFLLQLAERENIRMSTLISYYKASGVFVRTQFELVGMVKRLKRCWQCLNQWRSWWEWDLAGNNLRHNVKRKRARLLYWKVRAKCVKMSRFVVSIEYGCVRSSYYKDYCAVDPL